MKRKLRTNKKFSKQNGKRGSKKVYKKRNSKSLRKTTKRGRSGSRKMRGGADLFDTDESTILSDGESHDLDTSLSLDETHDEEGHTDSEAETTRSQNSFSGVAGLSGISAGEQGPNASFENSAGTMSVGELDLSNASSASGVTDRSDSFGGKRRKGKKTQKRRRGKKGGENPPTFNSYIDKVADPDHD